MISIMSCAYADVGSSLDAILGGYAHMPGLRLTCEQACRLYELSDARCQAIGPAFAPDFSPKAQLIARVRDCCQPTQDTQRDEGEE